MLGAARIILGFGEIAFQVDAVIVKRQHWVLAPDFFGAHEIVGGNPVDPGPECAPEFKGGQSGDHQD